VKMMWTTYERGICRSHISHPSASMSAGFILSFQPIVEESAFCGRWRGLARLGHGELFLTIIVYMK
jgi:hypothetical protein